MRFVSTRLVVADIKAVVGFYELVTGQVASWLGPQFAEIVTSTGALAFGGTETVGLFAAGSAEPAANRSAILEFLVADVDAEYSRLKGKVEVVHEPKTLPWGNRTVQFRDPEGTSVALFTPVTDAARTRFAAR